MAIADTPARLSAAGRIGRELAVWSPSLKIGGAIFLVILLAGIFAPLLTPYDPYYQDYNAILLAPALAAPASSTPSSTSARTDVG